MSGNRKAATEVAITLLKRLAPKGTDYQIWQKKLEAMSDKEFETFVKEVESGESFFTVFMPNMISTGITVENNIKLLKELGNDPFQRVWVKGKEGEPDYLTQPALILTLPDRRQSQTLLKKRSVPHDNKTIDAMTGQPTGASKGSRMSFVELQLCDAMGLQNSSLELMKARGGDNGARNALNGLLSRYGKAEMKVVNQYSSGVTSTNTLKSFMIAAHLKPNL